MQQMRPKRKQKQRVLEEVENVDNQPSSLGPVQPSMEQEPIAVTAVQEKEELGSWEDLHDQATNLEAMYPSAPSTYVLEFEEPNVLVSFPAPLLTMDKSNTDAMNYESLLANHSLLYPSAPEFNEDHLDLNNASAPLFETSQLEWNPLPSEILEGIYSNPLELEHLETVTAFLNSVNVASDENPFYRRLREYELSLLEIDDTRIKIRREAGAIEMIAKKYWTLTREPVTVREYCPEGWKLSHTFINEKAVMHSALDINFENAFHNLKSIVYVDFARVSYASKVLYSLSNTH